MPTTSKKKQKKVAQQMGLYPTGTPRKPKENADHPINTFVNPKTVKNRRNEFEQWDLELISARQSNMFAKRQFLDSQLDLMENILDYEKIYNKINENNEQLDATMIKEYLESRDLIFQTYFPPADNNLNEVPSKLEQLKQNYEALLEEKEICDQRGTENVELHLDFRYLEIEIMEVQSKLIEEEKREKMIEEMNRTVYNFNIKVIKNMRQLLKQNNRQDDISLAEFYNLIKLAKNPDPCYISLSFLYTPSGGRNVAPVRKGKK